MAIPHRYNIDDLTSSISPIKADIETHFSTQTGPAYIHPPPFGIHKARARTLSPEVGRKFRAALRYALWRRGAMGSIEDVVAVSFKCPPPRFSWLGWTAVPTTRSHSCNQAQPPAPNPQHRDRLMRQASETPLLPYISQQPSSLWSGFASDSSRVGNPHITRAHSPHSPSDAPP